MLAANFSSQDNSIVGPRSFGEGWFRDHLPGKFVPKVDERDWFLPLEGAELVSRVLSAPNDLSCFENFKSKRDIKEIGHYLGPSVARSLLHIVSSATRRAASTYTLPESPQRTTPA